MRNTGGFAAVATSPHKARFFACALMTPILLLALLQLPGQGSASAPAQAASQVSYSRLKHKVGAYNLTQATDVPRASRAGFQMVLARNAGDSPLTRALASNKMQYIDSSVQSLLYRAYCPTGLNSCKPLTLYGHLKLSWDVRAHVRKAKATGTVAAYYILDDYYIDMGPGLATVRGAIRAEDRATPAMCAFYQDLAYVGRDGRLVASTTHFARSLRNYSPRWCDAVGIYSYAPSATGRTAPPRPTVEWDMGSTLPRVMATLRSKGWDPNRHMLVGMPGAFGYEPRTGKPSQGTFPVPQWRFAPTTRQLAAQTVAFCKAGAAAILPYVWNDNSPGTAYALHNSVSLRAGVQQGAAACRQRYWK